MLQPRWAFPEPTVVRDVHQKLSAIRHKLPHEVRKNGLVADEGRHAVFSHGKHNHLLTCVEIAGFSGDLVDETERPGHKLAERHQMHLVVTAQRSEERRVGKEWRAR